MNEYGSGTGRKTTRLGDGTGTKIAPPPVPVGDGEVIFGNALRDIFNSPIGDDAVYTPSGGMSIACRVIITRDVLLQPASMDTQVFDHGTTIEAILEDIGAEPNRGDTFVIGTETFTVQSIEQNDGLTVKVIVT